MADSSRPTEGAACRNGAGQPKPPSPLAAAAHHKLFTRLVLIDGGDRRRCRPTADPDAVLQTTLGPLITRPGRRFANEEDYVKIFRAPT